MQNTESMIALGRIAECILIQIMKYTRNVFLTPWTKLTTERSLLSAGSCTMMTLCMLLYMLLDMLHMLLYMLLDMLHMMLYMLLDMLLYE